jgi:hypothetical protein
VFRIENRTGEGLDEWREMLTSVSASSSVMRKFAAAVTNYALALPLLSPDMPTGKFLHYHNAQLFLQPKWPGIH